MPSFPLMRDLPHVVNSEGWDWQPFNSSREDTFNFWLGTDRQGNRWLTKLRGGFRAYREIVFSRIAKQMGWSCQSSVFLRLDKAAAKTTGRKPGEIHAAHWLLNEQDYPLCSDHCSLAPLRGRSIESVADILKIQVAHAIDWPKSELAACLFGGHEPPGRLFTTSHELVIIDSELMFASGPCRLDNSKWWGTKDNPTKEGFDLAREVCEDFVALGRESLKAALELPKGLAIKQEWRVAPHFYKSFDYTESFIEGAHAKQTTFHP